ncbi:MAG: M20/M25/M40 family metallo-hydrolase [Azospirillaceae bacterium]
MGTCLVDIGDTSRPPDLMLLGYAMTHPAAEMVNPFAGELVERDGETLVRGRGVAEQKAALAAMIVAAEAAADRVAGRRIVIAVTPAGETGRHDAARLVLEKTGVPRMCVVGIGTGNRIALGNKGRIDITVDVHGRAAHSSTPEAGIDAIEGGRRILELVRELAPVDEVHADLGPATLVATSIDSWPDATHTIQSRVRIVLDRRLLPGQDPQATYDNLANALSLPAPWRVTTELGPVMYPCLLDPDGPMMNAAREAVRRAGWPLLETFWMKGALDAGLIHHLGGEAAMWGPGDPAQWHSDDETVSVSELKAAAEAYRRLIELAD